MFGLIGIVTPVLPTTPFLLLTAFCFLRSSDRLYEWLIHHKVFGTYIHNYIKYHAVSKRAKVTAIVFLWVSLSVSFILINIILVRILLVAVGAGVSLHIILLKTLNKNIIERVNK